jgi:hypothetical protein
MVYANPIAFAAKKTSDPDNPTLKEAMLSPAASEFKEAIGIEITALEKKATWTKSLRPSLPRFQRLPSTWTLKIKRYPDGRVRKYKARYCMRGDKQIKGVDDHETCAPVVASITVRMIMVMAAYVLKLDKSLYRLCQAPKSWFFKQSAELHTLGFVPSVNDRCMFVHPDMIVLVYCDDCLVFTHEQSTVDDVIARIRKAFPGGITVEDSVFAFLDVEVFTNAKTGKTWTIGTPTTLGSDQLGEGCVAEWDYASVVGVLMYLSSNSYQGISLPFTSAPALRPLHGRPMRKQSNTSADT